MSEVDKRLSPLVKKVDQLISKITSSGQHASSNLINEVGQVCVDLTPSRDQSWRAAKRVLAVGSIENKGYLAMCLVDSIVRHETKHKSPDAQCSFANLFADHVCRLTRRALSVHATDSELGRMGKMLQGWVSKKRFDAAVTKKLKALIPDATDVVNNGLRRRRQSKRKRRSRDLDDGASPTVSPSRAGTGTTVLHHGLMVDQFLRDEEDDDDHHPAERGSPREEEEELVTRPPSPLLPPAVDPRPVPSGEQVGEKEARPSSPGGGFTKPPEAGDAWTSSPPAGGVREMRGSARSSRNEERDRDSGSHRRRESRRGSRRSQSRERGHRGRSRSAERGSRSGRSRSRDRHASSSSRRHQSRQPEQRSRSPRDGCGSSRHRSSSHGRRSFGRHAEGDVSVDLPKRASQHSGWDVVPTGAAAGPVTPVEASPAAPPPPPYSAQGFNNPIGFPPIPGPGAPPPAAFVPPQFPGMIGMPPQGPLGGAFAGARPQPMYPMPSASPPPPPPPAFGQGMNAPFAPPPIPQPAHPARTKAPAFPWRPATVQRPQGVSAEAKTGEKDDDDESSEMDIDSPRVVEEKEVVVIEKEEVAGVEPAKGESSPTAAEEADALDSLGEVSNQEEKGGDKGEEEDEFNWD